MMARTDRLLEIGFRSLSYGYVSYPGSGQLAANTITFTKHIFECLCIAGLLLERGEVERNPAYDWRTIVHRDLKLENVFLAASDRDRFCHYPTPKIGDFGLAEYAPYDDDLPAVASGNTAQTPGNHPIEQRPDWMDALGRERFHVSSKTNVWGMANIVATLMLQVDGMQSSMLNLQHNAEEDVRLTKKMAPFYSRALRKLLEDCMRWHPSDRLTFEEIWVTIKENRKSNQAGLRDEPSGSQKWQQYLLEHDCINEVREFL